MAHSRMRRMGSNNRDLPPRARGSPPWLLKGSYICFGSWRLGTLTGCRAPKYPRLRKVWARLRYRVAPSSTRHRAAKLFQKFPRGPLPCIVLLDPLSPPRTLGLLGGSPHQRAPFPQRARTDSLEGRDAGDGEFRERRQITELGSSAAIMLVTGNPFPIGWVASVCHRFPDG